MTTHSEQGNRGSRGGIGLGVGVWLLVIALVVAAFLMGRMTRHHQDDVPFVEDPTRRAVAEQQLEDAQKTKKWSDQQHRAFFSSLTPLSPQSRHELLGKLAGLINTNAVIVEHDPNPPDPPVCPYVPGPCPDPTKSGAAQTGKAAAR